MQRGKIRQVVLPLLAAIIWGVAFVAQSEGAEYLDCFAFNAARSVIAGAELLIACLIIAKVHPAPKKSEPETRREKRDLLVGGLCCGVFLMVASNLQQAGIQSTSASKAGFITALYIVLVPVWGIFFKKRVRPLVWLSVLIAVAGLYLLSMTGEESFSLASGDFYLFLCAIVFTFHIMSVDYFTRRVNGLQLSCAQLIVMAFLSALCSALFEDFSMERLLRCLPFVLYAGVLSSGVGYTLQILAQKDGDPTVVTLLLSMESFFAAVFGALLLHERLSGAEYLGCALMLTAVILSQLPERKRPAAEESAAGENGK